MRFNAAKALALVEREQTVANRGVGSFLHACVDGGEGTVTIAECVGAEPLDDFNPHHFCQVGGIQLDRRLMWKRMAWRRLGSFHLLRADRSDLGHALQHIVAPDHRPVWIGQRIAARRELRNRGEHGRLRQVELIQALAVIELGRGGDAVRAITEENLVQVELEDLVLAQFALKAKCQKDL